MASGFVRQSESVANGNVGRNGIKLEVETDAVLTLGISIDSDYIGICILNFVDDSTAHKRSQA